MAETTIDRILRMRRMGMSNNQIGAILGITGTQVAQMLKDPTIADPVTGGQVSRSAYRGDVIVANPNNENPVNVGAALQVIPDHPLLVDVGFYANIPDTHPGFNEIQNNGVVEMKLLALVGGVEMDEFADWIAYADVISGWQKTTELLTNLTCNLQVQARFRQGTLPSWTLTMLGPDFKVTTQHYNADQTDFVNASTGVLAHGITAANLAAALNAIDDLPGVFTVVQVDADHYTVTAPHHYNAMDVVGADGQWNVNVGGAVGIETDVPNPPASVTFEDVSIFFGTA